MELFTLRAASAVAKHRRLCAETDSLRRGRFARELRMWKPEHRVVADRRHSSLRNVRRIIIHNLRQPNVAIGAVTLSPNKRPATDVLAGSCIGCGITQGF